MTASKIQCMHHLTLAKCEAIAAGLIRDGAERYELSVRFGDALWKAMTAAFGMRPFERFLERFDPCDCWRYGDPPIATLERSALLWHHPVREGKTAAAFVGKSGRLGMLCPIEAEWFRAMERARLSLFRLRLVDGETRRLEDVFSSDTFELANPLNDHWLESEDGDCVITRVVSFRGKHYVSSEDQPNETYDAADAARIEKEVRGVTKEALGAHPRFPWALLSAGDDIIAERQEAEMRAYDGEMEYES